MARQRLVQLTTVAVATKDTPTHIRETARNGRFDLEADGRFVSTVPFNGGGWGVRSSSGNFTPSTYADFRNVTLIGVAPFSFGRGEFFRPVRGDVVCLLSPADESIILRWTATADADYDNETVWWPVAEVADSFDTAYQNVAAPTESLLLGHLLHQEAISSETTRKSWARLRDRPSVAGLLVDAADPMDAREQEAVAIVRYRAGEEIGIRLVDDLKREWEITGSELSEDRAVVSHDLLRVVSIAE